MMNAALTLMRMKSGGGGGGNRSSSSSSRRTTGRPNSQSGNGYVSHQITNKERVFASSDYHYYATTLNELLDRINVKIQELNALVVQNNNGVVNEITKIERLNKKVTKMEQEHAYLREELRLSNEKWMRYYIGVYGDV